MTQFLPPNLLALFAPREQVPYLPPVDKLTHEKKRQPYTGVAEFLDYFEDPEETPPPVRVETKAERLERKRREKAEQVAYKLEQDLALWDPQSNSSATSDPYKTLFVGRINYDTSESKLKREFEVYGKIKSIKLVNDSNTGKPRGYAFIEFEDEGSMHAAYKKADGKKIGGRRVVVDIERGRTIEGWKPRRLGGGKGGTRRTAAAAGGTSSSNGNHNNSDMIDDFDTKVTSSNSRVDRIERRSSRDRDDNRGGDRDRGDRDRDRERKRSRDKRSRSRSRDRKRRSRSKDRQRSKSREKSKKSRKDRSKSKERHKKRSRSRDRDRSNKNAIVEDSRNGGGGGDIDAYDNGDNGY